MHKVSLQDLPDDIVLEVIDHLDTARDVAHLSRLARHTHSLVQQDGWRTFVRTRFPSLDIPSNAQTIWSAVADRATYLDRCWDKRGFRMSVLHENKKPQHPRAVHRRERGVQNISFHSVVDARLSSSLQDEIVAVGVGENLMVQTRPVDHSQPDLWHQVSGQSLGYQAGTGDVTAVAVIEHDGHPGTVVGRATGDVQILTGKDDFASVSRNLTPMVDDDLNRGFGRLNLSPGQRAIAHLQWHPETNMLASCRGTVLNLYDLSNGEDELGSIASWDFSKRSLNDEASLLRDAKFMSKDVLACALGGTREPLRWGQITPTGIEFINAARNPRLRDILPEIRAEEKTAIRAIGPVRGAGDGNLLLSAWADGTYR